MDQLLQHLLNGLLLGATYSLLGIGLTLVFGLMSVVNFAHGEFYTLGAYAAFAALTVASVHFFLAIPLAIVVGAAAGAVCERGLLRPLRGQSIDTVMLVMIGLWIWETSWPFIVRLILVLGIAGWNLLVFLPNAAKAQP